MSFRSKPVGWRGESHRHYLASKGIVSKMGARSLNYLAVKGMAEKDDVRFADLQRRSQDAGMRLVKDGNFYKFEGKGLPWVVESIDDVEKHILEVETMKGYYARRGEQDSALAR